MTSRPKFFSWSKGRTPSSEPHHRTGGLLSLDTTVGDGGKEACLASHFQNAPRPGRRRPPMLNLTIPSGGGHHVNCLSPASARHNAALVNSASNLLAVVNDMLRSPGLSATVCHRSAEIHKPLPSRPRSVSLPPTPAESFAVELPGSLLLENQGFPVSHTVELTSHRASTMRSVRSGSSLSNTASTRPNPSKLPQHKKCPSEAGLQRRSQSKPNLITSPSSTSIDSKTTAWSLSTNGGNARSTESTKTHSRVEKSLQPSPLIVEAKPARSCSNESLKRRDEHGTPDTPTPTPRRSRQIEELKSTITAQDNTISTLQSQFGSLRASHEAHVASLVDSHAAEIASLKNYTRVLEEQQSQRTLHHASSNHLLLFLDHTEPQTPTRESPQTAAGNTSATSIKSFKTALDQPLRSPHPLRESPDMESFKRKLSAARRPETGNRDMIRELNQQKQNITALQKQIESLMAKLNQSKKNERTLLETLEGIEKTCDQWQEKANRADKLEKSNMALQNTIDHLEYRLEMANTARLDAEEHVFNLQNGREAFDPTPPRLQVPEPRPTDSNERNAHLSAWTVFSSASPTTNNTEAQDSSTLSAFISRIERLQEDIKQRDLRIEQLEQECEQQRHLYGQLQRDHTELNLQSEIQEQLIKKTKDADAHIEQLRSTIINREATIGEKEKALRMAERQLEHHKLLLHAEVRKHATMSLFADTGSEPLPDITTLASKGEIDKWVTRLQARLKKEQNHVSSETRPDDLAIMIKDLQSEIDFYVREIIYYKLDIKGYKSDIKKLKSIATRMTNFSRASDVESPTPPRSQSITTPVRARYQSVQPGLSISNTSPAPADKSSSFSAGRPVTPNAAAMLTPAPSPAETIKPAFTFSTFAPHKHFTHGATPMTPQTPSSKTGFNVANEADNIEPGVSPRSVPRLSPERRKPTPPSPEQERWGDMATNFPINTPAAPKRHDTQRSMSDSIIQLYTAPRTPEWSPASDPTRLSTEEQAAAARQRSVSVPPPHASKMTPERPPRPRYGLFESVAADSHSTLPSTPPRTDVMAEAMRNSPDQNMNRDEPTPLFGRKFPDFPKPPSHNHPPYPASSGSSSTPAPSRPQSRAERAQQAFPKRTPSAASGSTVPFIIGMPSPHNPALVNPTATVLPTTCSITGKCSSAAPLNRNTSRTGVGGTMASTTPATTPVEGPSNASSPRGPNTRELGPSMAMLSHKDNDNIENTIGDSSEKKAGWGAHSRSISASSLNNIRNAMMMKGKGRTSMSTPMRKEDISRPTPLASPFDIDRTNSAGPDGVGQAV